MLEWQKQLPRSLPDCLELIGFVIIKYFIRRPGISFVCDQRINVVSVDDAIGSHPRPGQERKRWQEAHCCGKLITNSFRSYDTRPPHNCWHPEAAFGCCVSPTTQRFIGAQLRPPGIICHRCAIVRSENNKGITVDAFLNKLVQDLADRPIKFFNAIAPRIRSISDSPVPHPWAGHASENLR